MCNVIRCGHKQGMVQLFTILTLLLFDVGLRGCATGLFNRNFNIEGLSPYNQAFQLTRTNTIVQSFLVQIMTKKTKINYIQ